MAAPAFQFLRLPATKWTLHALSPEAGPDGVNISDCIVEAFRQRYRGSWLGTTFVERVSLEEWAQDWKECE